MPNARQPSRHAVRVKTSGFSLVEFLLVSIPLLLCALGGVELAYWFSVRQIVDLALVEAARAGAAQHAQPAAIAQAFEDALRPLFAGSKSAASNPDATAERVALALGKRASAMGGNPPWQIRIVRPDARDYARFAAPSLNISSSGLPAIRNDYQAEQQRIYLRTHAGNASGDDDASVFAANTLVLRLTYPHPPLIPGIARLIASLSVHTDAYAQRALAAGLLPMVREVSLDMASHPVDWSSLPDGRVIKGETLSTVVGAPAEPNMCSGLWCQPPTPPEPSAPSQLHAPEPQNGGTPDLPGWAGSPSDGEADDGRADEPPDATSCS